MNHHCPTCGSPLTAEGTPTYVGIIKFCMKECVDEWYRRHDRRKTTAPVLVERRAS